MDGVSLGVKESFGMGISQEGLLPPGSPIPEREGTLVITLPSHELSKDLQEKILDEIFDLRRYFTFYQVQQGDTQINIYRNTDFQFVYRHYNSMFGEREIKLDFADAERQGARAFQIFTTWSPEKNSLHVALIHANQKFDGLRQGIALSQDKLRLIEENINTLEEMLNEQKEERVHQFLKNNGVILGVTSTIEPISKYHLGNEYVTDFVIREIPDGYVLVEIERPGMPLFNKTTPPERTADFNHAIQQIENWKVCVAENHSYISKRLGDISPNPMCWLIAGRRTSLSEVEQKRLKEINELYRNTNFRIFAYDDLIDRVRAVIRNVS